MGSFPSPDIFIPDEWSQAANSIVSSSTPPVVLVCGPGSVGKSTFARYLLNLLLATRCKKVAYLDTDVGQTEFTPLGLISLTVVHEVTPDLKTKYLKPSKRSLFFGDISPKIDPSVFLEYVCSIYDHYQKKYRTFDKRKNASKIQTPLIVNTSGWVKGVGYEVLVDMLKYIGPTHVVKIGLSTEFYKFKNLPAGKFWLDGEDDGTIKLIEIDSVLKDRDFVQKEARLLRGERIVAYFEQCFPSDSDMSSDKEITHSLTSHCPYQVPIASIKIRHVHREVPSSEIFYGLNASIVGLAVESEVPGDLPWCLGLGIVRGIDTVKGMLYVITPVPFVSLKKVNLLLQGDIQIPTCLLQVQGRLSPYISENVLSIT